MTVPCSSPSVAVHPASRASAPATGKVTARWTVETRGVRSSEPSGIAAGAGSVWLARGAEVVRVDAETGRVQHRFPLAVTATLLQFAGGDLWAASSENGRGGEDRPGGRPDRRDG